MNKNINNNANVDDGSCITKVLGCMDKNTDNYNDCCRIHINMSLSILYPYNNKNGSYILAYKVSLDIPPFR